MTTEIKTKDATLTVFSDPLNKRIRIDDYAGDLLQVITLINKSRPQWADKLIIKAKPEDLSYFKENGYTDEAKIKGYFNGLDMHFLARYFSVPRGASIQMEEADKILESIVLQPRIVVDTSLTGVTPAALEDAEALAQFYSSIFKIYPTPISDPEYIRKAMRIDTHYLLIQEQQKIISAASAEVNRKYSNAELTDCATSPNIQGKGYMRELIVHLETQLQESNIQCFYSIARATSFGINRIFYQLGYTYGGRLINNCYIYSGLEDMNVWFKNIPAN